MLMYLTPAANYAFDDVKTRELQIADT